MFQNKILFLQGILSALNKAISTASVQEIRFVVWQTEANMMLRRFTMTSDIRHLLELVKGTVDVFGGYN